MAKKRGLITNVEKLESREKAIKVGKTAKKKLESKGFIPFRLDANTVILLNPDKDHQTQIDRYLSRLQSDR